MRVKKILSRIILAILILGIIAGAVWVLDWLAVIDVSNTARKIPVIGKMVPADKETDKNKDQAQKKAQLNPLEEENKKLKADIEKLKGQAGKLQKELETVNKEKQTLLTERENLKNTLDTLKNAQAQQEGTKLSYQKLAQYYAEMKPDAAVGIMNNLSDEVIVGILQYLENDQVAKILSAMDPERAAEIVEKMKQ